MLLLDTIRSRALVAPLLMLAPVPAALAQADDGADPSLNASLLSPVSDLIAGAGSDIDLVFGRAGNDVFFAYDPVSDAGAPLNIDILFGDLFDNTDEEFAVTLALEGGDPFFIVSPDAPEIPSIGSDRFVLGDEFEPYYTSADPASLLTTNALGLAEFAVVYDFEPDEDIIQLHGDKDDYRLLKIGALPVSAITGDGASSSGTTDFSGYAVFGLFFGVPDLVALIVQEPDVELKLEKSSGFRLVGDKPKDDPKRKESVQFGSFGLDYGYGVATDAADNLYVVGSTSGNLNGPNAGSSDVWVTKYDRQGRRLFAIQPGSAGGESAVEIVTDADGHFYLAGSASGSFVAPVNSSGGTDAWVAKFDERGNLLWGRQFGARSAGPQSAGFFGFSTSGTGLQVDDVGNVYLSGLTINENRKGVLDFPVEDDAFVIKLDGAGDTQWITRIVAPPADRDPNLPFLASAPLFDESYDLAVDGAGNAYLTGWTQGLTAPSDPGRLLQNYDAWLAKVEPGGAVEWVRQFGSVDEGLEFAWGVDTDSQGNVYAFGWTTGALGDIEKEFDKAAARDLFLAKFTPAGELLFVRQIGSKGDDGAFFSDLLIDAADNVFLTGYTDDKLGEGDKDEALSGWVGRFDTEGRNRWVRQIGVDERADYATGLATNAAGELFVSGFSEGLLGTAATPAAQGAAIDAWLARVDIEKGKLLDFDGGRDEVREIAAPVTTRDVTRLFATDVRPRGDGKLPSLGTYYGDIASGMAPYFDPDAPGSVQAALLASLGGELGVGPSDCRVTLRLDKIEDEKIRWTLSNPGATNATIDTLTLSWPGSEAIDKIKFDGAELLKGGPDASPATIGPRGWLKEIEDRSLDAGEEGRKLEIEFTGKFPLEKDQPGGDFALEAGFVEGCAVTSGARG